MRSRRSSGWDALLRLSIAGALGAAVGFERELRDREAGIRTHLLVSLGSALFTIISAYGFHEFLVGGGDDRARRSDAHRRADRDRHRLPRRRRDHPRRALGARPDDRGDALGGGRVGMACGAGYYWPAVAATVLTIVALWPLRLVAYRTIERMKPEENRLIVELSGRRADQRVPRHARRVRHFELREEADRRVVQLELGEVERGASSRGSRICRT